MDERTARRIQRLLADFSKGKTAAGADIASLKLDRGTRADFDLASLLAPPDLTFGAIANAYPRLAKEMGERDMFSSAALLGGLLTMPDLQGNSFRLQVLAHMAIHLCRGPRKPKLSQITPWFDMLDRGDVGRQEDPAEDLFIELVVGNKANYRIFAGTIEAAAFTTEIFLSFLETSSSPIAPAILQSVFALLKLSEEIARRSELPRNIVGFPNPRRRLTPLKVDISEMLRTRVTFDVSELKALEIDPVELDPFVLGAAPTSSFSTEEIGNSSLERFPLLRSGDKIIVSNPPGIAIAIRRFVIESFLASSQQGELEDGLSHAFGRRLGSDRAFRTLPPLPLEFQRRGNAHIAELVSFFDSGHPLQIIAVVDGLNSYAPDGMLGRVDDAALTRDVQAGIRAAWQRFSSDPEYRGGLTLVIGCSWGRSGMAMPRPPAADWLVESISAHDFITYGRSEGGTVSNLYAMLIAEQKLQRIGIDLANVNGLLNLHAWANKNHGHLVPHERLSADFVSEDGGASLQIPLNSLLEVRHDVASGWDEHGLVDPNGRFIRVRRRHSTPGFGMTALSPFYLAAAHPFTRETVAVYHGGGAEWWMTCSTVTEPEGEADQLSEVALLWAERVARSISKSHPGLTGKWHWKIKFSQQASMHVENTEIPPLAELVSFRLLGNTAHISVSSLFGAAGARSANDAEKRFAAVLLESALAMAGIVADDEAMSILMRDLVPSDGARQMHAFTVPDDRDFVRDDLPPPRKIESLADPSSRIGLGWLCRDRSKGDELHGAECIPYLNDVVKSVIQRMRDRVKLFDRGMLIIFALRRHEAVTYEERRFRRSSRSMSALADDPEKMVEDIGVQISQLNATSLTSRIVAEMALCWSPLQGGITPGSMDLDELMADAAILYYFGGYSDAMNAGVMEQVIKISPAGNVLMNHSFTNNTITPFGVLFQGGRLKHAADTYEANFSNDVHQPEASNSPELEPAFLTAWGQEFGFPFQEIRLFLHAFIDIAAEGKAVVLTDKRALVVKLAELTGDRGELRPDHQGVPPPEQSGLDGSASRLSNSRVATLAVSPAVVDRDAADHRIR
nr:hypothetical protein [Rhizobium leguminosarum]